MEKGRKNDNFLFHVPVKIDKAKGPSDESWKIRGIASTSDKDSQNEVIIQNGLDISHLKQGLGFFNYDHHKGPENLIGQITEAKKVDHGLMVEGYLFKEQPKAKAVNNIMRSLNKGSEHRVKMSIEGKVLKRKGNKIMRAKVTNVALTMNPINDNTYAEFKKSFASTDDLSEGDFIESPASPDKDGSEVTSSTSDPSYNIFTKLDEIHDVVKGLATGNYNVPPSSREQGAALAKESLDKKKKKIKYDEEKVKRIYKKARALRPDLTKSEMLEVIEAVYGKTK